MKVFVILVDDGFCMEPDVSVYGVYSSYSIAVHVKNGLLAHHRHCYIQQFEVK